MKTSTIAILVCGGIGAGKSTFCEQFQYYFKRHSIERFDCDEIVKSFLNERSYQTDYYTKRILDEAGVDIHNLSIETYSKCTPTQIGIVQSYLVSFLFNAAYKRYMDLTKIDSVYNKYLLIDGALIERLQFPDQHRIILDCPESVRKDRVLRTRGEDYNFDFRASLQLSDMERLAIEGTHIDTSEPIQPHMFSYLDLIFEKEPNIIL